MYSMFYAGYNNPHILWEEFESRFTVAFPVVGKHEGSKFHPNESKWLILNNKNKADFLEISRNYIALDMKNTPITVT